MNQKEDPMNQNPAIDTDVAIIGAGTAGMSATVLRWSTHPACS